MAEKRAGKGGMGGVIIAAVVVVLAAAGGGAGLGFMIPIAAAPAEHKQEKPADTAEKPEEHEATEASVIVQPLPPIVTNLATPSNTWLRLEASLLIDIEAKAEAEELAARASADILAFVRTVALAQVEGPSGYQHFREDLLDTVRATSEGKIKQITIATMVVE